jgi:periplasmic protein TonB
MFEDSTFESTGRIRTRSRGWMIASFAFNGSILLALILLPLIYPDALPRQAIAYLMEAPPPPAPPTPPTPERVRAAPMHSELTYTGSIQAPSVIPKKILDISTPEPHSDINVAALGPETIGIGGSGPIFSGQTAHPIVRSVPAGPVRLPSSVVAARLIQKTLPFYPPIAKAAGVQGTVVLQATISKVGTVENLRAVSGPPMLQQSALDAVKTWRYQPYELNGQPFEIETTVNVVFILGRQ